MRSTLPDSHKTRPTSISSDQTDCSPPHPRVSLFLLPSADRRLPRTAAPDLDPRAWHPLPPRQSASSRAESKMAAANSPPAAAAPTAHPSGREKHGQVVQVLRTVSVALYFLAGAIAYAPPRILPPTAYRLLTLGMAGSMRPSSSAHPSTGSTASSTMPTCPSRSSPSGCSSPP